VRRDESSADSFLDSRSASAGQKTATPASQTYGMYEEQEAHNHPVDVVLGCEKGCIHAARDSDA
jgi:hypothetical protein